jgi:hypothetical protein
VIDLTRTTSSTAGWTVTDAERAKLSEAATHFRAAAEALSRAVEVCASRAKLRKPDAAAPLDCDSGGLERLGAILARLAAPRGGTLPALDDLEAAMAVINDGLAAWRLRTDTTRGLPGHYPARATPHP